MPIQAVERSHQTVHITVSDALRAEDLALIRQALQLGGRPTSVVVDFRGTRESSPSVLMDLLDLFLSFAVTYELTGLSQGSRRLLEYLEPIARNDIDLISGGDDDGG